MIYFEVLEISDPNINKGIPCLIRNFMLKNISRLSSFEKTLYNFHQRLFRWNAFKPIHLKIFS